MVQASTKQRPDSWLRKLPFLAFLFFLVKGLLWVIVPAILVVLHAGD
jgi:hypothetical protein